MRPLLIALALVAGACASPAAVEAPAGSEAALRACIAAADTRGALDACKSAMAQPCAATEHGATTAGMIRCYAAETRVWSALLEAALDRARGEPHRRALLDAAQRDWLAWREAECAYQASLYAGGSLARVLHAGCVNDLTANRAIDFIVAERNPL